MWAKATGSTESYCASYIPPSEFWIIHASSWLVHAGFCELTVLRARRYAQLMMIRLMVMIIVVFLTDVVLVLPSALAESDQKT